MTDTAGYGGPWKASAAEEFSPAASAAPAQKIESKYLRKFLTLEEFEAAAKRKLPRVLYGYAASGTETDASLRQNRESYTAYGLVPRVLMGKRKRDMGVSLFGRRYSAPFGIAPMGASALFAYRADIRLAEAAKSADIPMVLSGASLIALEEVAQAAPGTWFQAYLPAHPEQIRRLLERLARAGYETLVVTVDVPVPGNREVDKRNGFNVTLKPSAGLIWDGITRPAWLVGTALRTTLLRGMPHLENYRAVRGPSILSRADIRGGGAIERHGWAEIRLVRSLWKGNLVVKGILSAADARLAQDCGVDGIVISNHGGRQLDGAVAPLRVLPTIREAVPRLTVMIDGGIRRGTDMIKALALGSDFVFMGRPFLYAAAVGGADGVTRAIHLMREEIQRDMVLLGIGSLSELDASFVSEASCWTSCNRMNDMNFRTN
ncbi:MAG: alpha-hydroxy-acid oxidizing enzyme [Alphaproteobacteria bacterium 64-11]|nr:alpha-hydroxy-acid oxidizing protein [Alphaproteobacteria bacterium]OJU08125.1 MAG: alpha-hydroxy-acid oxidizing enzyme [Alphaproteobacteria bacterium 64-11]